MLILFLAPLSPCATLEVHLATPENVQDRLERGAVGARVRQSTIHKLFEEAGCEVEEQRVGRNSSNVVCELKGETDSTIVIGGHFDFVDRGQGIVDD